ncbi:lysophospholipid acyltransferase family protein [Desulforhopalus singaporensis]|uniref:lysophospholipid acyltransferase family protein n=1 Tax=Desulforhopalus singaporensis TaxID=91360 RepID=UPI0015A42113|nr:lysophospholipid acyltransferase family protein [Desulforhopalus singaporensis]
MLKLLWNVYFWLVFVILTVTGLFLLPVVLLLIVFIRKCSPDGALRRAIRLYGWILTRVVPFGAPVEVEYKSGERLPSTAIFVANHNSAIDPYLFGTIPVENGFVTSWPFRIPVYGFFMRLAGYADARKGWDSVREKCIKLLNAGCSVTIWPEGHRSCDFQLGRFKNGAFSLSVDTGRPIVPVCILGSGSVLPPGHMLMTPGRVRLIVLDPVYPECGGGDRGEAVRNLRRRIRGMLEAELSENKHFRIHAVG